MANVLIFNIFLVLILPSVESCFIPKSIHVQVPQTIQAGYQITRVTDCDSNSVHLTSKDPSFTVEPNGEIVALTAVSVATTGRTFSVWAQDNSGLGSEMEVHLVRSTVQERKTGQGFLKRSKRRWSPPPFNILENDKGPFPKNIEEIVSDSASTRKVYYTFSGPGFDKYPEGVFSLDRYTGMLIVHKPVDREEFPSFTLTTNVYDQTTNEPTDLPLDINIIVDDVNDNAPTFTDQRQFTVLEQSKAGTIVGMVNATDKDKKGSLHVKIRYSLLDKLDLFSIHPETGVITTVTNTLDREVKDKHMVTVQIKDMDGANTGLSNTGTATITLADINDNPPTFTKPTYEVSVSENENEKLILRIPVEDKDLINTPNWISKFVITKGNENGNFRMATDPKTNEGLLYVSKALDYEQNQKINLQIEARNEAELSNTNAKWLSIPVDVAVTNVDEGPQFTAPTVRFTVKENVPSGTLIGTYTAVDPETKSSEGIKYYKDTDPASWINVDRNTGELKVANTIDRESDFVQNGIYNITMKAVDASSKTGTGTVIIVVEDENDNKPTLPSEIVLCEKEGELGSVLVGAEDNDQSPFSSPFSFSLPPDNDGKWSVKPLNGRRKVFSTEYKMYNTLFIKCSPSALISNLPDFFIAGILLAFFCATKGDKLEIDDAGDSGGILLKSNTEAPGEEVDSSLITVPTTMVDQAVKGSVKGSVLNAGWMGNKSSSTIGAHSTLDNGIYKSGVVTGDMHQYYSSQYDSQYGAQQFNGGLLEGDGRYADDIIHAYGFEGVGSVAGSVGCCSEYDDNDNLDFLNTLGPKFNTLADVCKST
uniref:Desmocollin 1 n=1 Tax=Dicentrarchus labrax TaxID=13489 RepID=A0A8C4HPT7_DICLA